MSEGPSGCSILIGLFLILFGLCLALLGGGCTVLLLSLSAGSSSGEVVPLLLVSLAVLGAGVIVIWAGLKMFRSGPKS